MSTRESVRESAVIYRATFGTRWLTPEAREAERLRVQRQRDLEAAFAAFDNGPGTGEEK